MHHADHTNGDNTSSDDVNEFVATTPEGYAALIANYNVAQQSWNYDFFDDPLQFPGTPLETFNPELNGVYDIYLKAYEKKNEIASVTVQVIVGDPFLVSPNPVAAGGQYTIITNEGIEPKTAPTEAGIYEDEACIDSVCTTLVVYDPDGSVKGDGKIDSPEGATLISVSEPVTVWSQDFSVDDSGWFDSGDAAPNVWYGNITPAGGTATATGDEDSAPYSRFDHYRDFWPGNWSAEIDVYLDPDWESGTGFDYSVASSGSDGAHQRDFIFHVTKDTSTGNLLVAGSNNTNFAPREDLENMDHFVVSNAGSYTLQHVFRDDGGVLSVDLNLLDNTVPLLFTETRSDPSDTIPAEVGGNRYSWFTFINVDGGILVDNHELVLQENYSPTGEAKFNFDASYRKNDTVPSGNTRFDFDEADLKFKSDSYEWLVVNEDATNAQYQGTGKINNALAPSGDPYDFMVWAKDLSPGATDTFRIKIWYEVDGDEVVVYDNRIDQMISQGKVEIKTE